ncbi:T9SS type A sorting domain-containing protein [Runella sp.]|uniref:T9SS type A sorting domain-containing protein n=1 Tax=Runella sp. TaxID=1960881 RepID=UPI003D09D471
MKKIIPVLLLGWLSTTTAFAQSFSCTAGSPVRVQFTGCPSTPTWADNSANATTLRTISTAGTYTVNCGATPYSFRITNINACPSFGCDLSLNSSNPVSAGQSSTLTYSGCNGGTVTWDHGLGTGNSKTVSPSATTTYNATCTPTNGLICTQSVTVNFIDCSITANASPSTATPGQSVTLSYTGCVGGSVDWVTGNDEGVGSGNNIVVNPSTTTNYIAACHKEGGYCLGSVTVTVSTCSVTASAGPTAINAGQTSTLSYSGCTGGTVTWNNGAGTGNNKTVSPSTTTTYTATCAPAGGGATCSSSATVTVTACSVLALAQNSTINAGQSTVLAYENCTNGSVSWDNGAGSGNNRTVSPTATTTYTATCTPTGGGTVCTSSVTVNVTSCTITASASPNNINAGQSSTLSYTGCSGGSVSWDNGAGNGNNKSVSPTATTTYTATCTPSGGGAVCTSSVTVNVTSCTITASASPNNINAGQSSTLSYTGCSGGSVSWDNGAGNGNNKSVSPTATTTYTATCTPSGGGAVCTSSVTVNVTSCTITASASPNNINAGQSSTLSYTGCSGGSVSWDNGAGSGNNKSVSPSTTTTYTATCTPSGGGAVCTSSVTVNVTSCTITASASPNNINAGQSSTLSYTGCSGGSVSWDNGAGSGNNKSVSPSTTTTYTATCTPSGGGAVCTSSVTVNVTSCTITASASPNNINAGQSSTLSYTGCSGGSVSWDNGVGNGNNKSVSPTATTTYTATCTPAGGGAVCTSSVTVNVTSCTITASASPNNINAGQSSTLSYTGCSGGSVSWDNGAGSGNNKSVSPSSTTTYTATCTPSGGGAVCTSSVTVNVTSCTITASASPNNINAGQSSTLSYTGCSGGSVSWDNGAGNGNNKSVSPSTTTTYTATCTPSGGGAVCTSSVTVNVTSCTITASASPNNINAGQSSTLSYTGCSGGSVSWDNGVGSGNNKSVSPSATTIYTATCTPNGGGSPCTSSVTVNVAGCSLNVSVSTNNLNAGQNATLSYSGCSNGTVTWDNGVGTGNNKSVSPASTTTYTATCMPSGGGSTCTGSVTVNVTQCTISASASPSNINAGQGASLSYSGCSNGTVTWDNGAGSGNNVIVFPSGTTTYTLTCTPSGGGNPCTASVTVNVTQCSIAAFASSDAINVGQTTTLSYTGCSNGSVNWNNGVGSGNNITLYLVSTTTYTATCVPFGGGNNCTANVTVTVSPAPIFIVSNAHKQPTCFGNQNGSLTLNLSRGTVVGETNIRLKLSKNGVNISEYFFQGSNFTTPENLEAGTYTAIIETFIGGTVSAQTEGIITINNPEPVSFSFSKSDIKCFGGADGKIEINATGGTGLFFYQLNSDNRVYFTNGNTHTIENVGLATYSLRVADSFNCFAPDQSVTVNQPSEPVGLTKIFQKDPRGFETKDGQAIVNVKGGTPGYVFEWTNEQGVSYGTGITNNAENANKTLRGGQYTVRVYDANYSIATQKNGCFNQATFTLVEPPIIEAKIDVATAITCFGKKDGVLLITPKGGVPSTTGYVLRLEKKSDSPTAFLSDKNQFKNLGTGQYTLTVTDANDVSRSFDYFLGEPQKVTVKITSIKDLTCNGDKNGSIEIAVAGGKSPYTASWSNKSKELKINNLVAGTYAGVAYDVQGCQSDIFSAKISEPSKVEISYKVSNPTCSNSCNGEVATTISGGVAPYSFAWNGRTDRALKIENLCGNESLTLRATDANQCVALAVIPIVKPAAIDLKIEKDRKICQGQSILLDATYESAASYLWKLPDGSTSDKPAIETQQTGVFTVSLFDKSKCEFKSLVNVASVQATGKIRFASASSAPRNEPIFILNLSEPASGKVEWRMPKEAVITEKSDQQLQFSIAALGDYNIGIKAIFAECELYQTKKITIVDSYPKTVAFNPEQLSLRVSPNPTFDAFEVTLHFESPTSFKLKIIDSAKPDVVLMEMEEKDKIDFNTKINARDFNSGTYILSVETPKDRITKKVSILR